MSCDAKNLGIFYFSFVIGIVIVIVTSIAVKVAVVVVVFVIVVVVVIVIVEEKAQRGLIFSGAPAPLAPAGSHVSHCSGLGELWGRGPCQKDPVHYNVF